jgi:hypothetical protein
MNDQAVEHVHTSLFSKSDQHVRRVLSLSQTVLGAVNAAEAGVTSVGRAKHLVRHVNPVKHAIKQVGRFLSKHGFEVALALRDVVRFVIGNRLKVIVSLDWTVYEGGGHHRIALNLTTRHGCATPLPWKTLPQSSYRPRAEESELPEMLENCELHIEFGCAESLAWLFPPQIHHLAESCPRKISTRWNGAARTLVPASELTDHRNDYEDELLRHFKELFPASIRQVDVSCTNRLCQYEQLHSHCTTTAGIPRARRRGQKRALQSIEDAVQEAFVL